MVFFIFARPAKKSKKFPPRIPPAPSCGAEAPVQKTFQKNQSRFCESSSRKIASQNRVRICISAHHIILKTLWWCAERFPALLLQQKLCASHRGASARGER